MVKWFTHPVPGWVKIKQGSTAGGLKQSAAARPAGLPHLPGAPALRIREPAGVRCRSEPALATCGRLPGLVRHLAAYAARRDVA
jgi:hypothetical protein